MAADSVLDGSAPAGGAGEGGAEAEVGGAAGSPQGGAADFGGSAGASSAAGAGGEGAGGEVVGGLCTTCGSSADCGDDSDHCVSWAGELFCGRDCSEGWGCPVGYDCSSISDANEPQCVPLTETCVHLEFKEPPPSPAAIRAEALDFINDRRAERGLYPYTLDDCLSLVAQESAVELLRSGDFLAKYERECVGQTSCECGWAGEAEASMAAYDLRYDDVIERPIEDALAGSPDNEYLGALLSTEYSRIGIGIALSGDEGASALSYGR